MARSFYYSALFVTGLLILLSFFRSFLHFELGAQLYALPSLGQWWVVEYLVSLLWSLILLKYFHFKQFRFTFWVMAVAIAASLYHFILLYALLTTRELNTPYLVATFLVSGIGILYAISLIFSKAGQRPWLKAAGIFSCLLGVAGMSALIWALQSIAIRQNGTMETIELWGTLLGSLVPVLYFMNFWKERDVAEKVSANRQPSWQGMMDVSAFIALAAMLMIGPKIAVESVRLSHHPDQVSDYQKKSAQPFEARTYVNHEGDTMRYRLLKPLDYDSTKLYPLVVCLHGSSGGGTDNVKQVASSLSALWLSEEGNRMKYPAFLFVPQCPQKAGWGGMPDVPAVDSLVFQTLNALEEELSIDKNRRYVVGISLGGYGAWHLIGTRPEKFAAAIPICGGGNPALAQHMVDVPVWAFHGAKDRNVPVSGSRDMIEAIRQQGGTPRYTEFPDKAHFISEEVKNTPGLLDWLFTQHRDEVK